jgi:hypothetical protein
MPNELRANLIQPADNNDHGGGASRGACRSSPAATSERSVVKS